MGNLKGLFDNILNYNFDNKLNKLDRCSSILNFMIEDKYSFYYDILS